MRWRFWKRRRPRIQLISEVTKETIPISTLVRWYCYDLGIDDVNSLVKEFNLMPVSDEGDSFEKDASEKRMDVVYPLFPFLDMMAEINAKAISTIQIQDFQEHNELLADIDPEIMEAIYKHISFACLLSSFSAAIQLGMVSRNYGFMGIEEGQDYEQ